MKKLFLVLLLLVAVKASAMTLCLTNVTIHITAPTGYVLVIGSTNYNPNSGVIEASGMDITSPACGNSGGCLLSFYVDGCPTSDTVVAVVTIECDTTSRCGPWFCPDGHDSVITITIPAYNNGVSGKLYQRFGCCEIDWCPLFYHNYCQS